MRKNIFLLISISISIFSIAQTTKKVLFLGNSYTYVNDLPTLIKNLATNSGNILEKDQNTLGGYTLEAHSTNTTSLSKISSNNWDFVIIQGQSQRPSFPPSQVETDVFPFAKILNDSVVANNTCSETLFFMTWGRQNGDQSNCSFYAPLCTYEGMQQRLRESYLQMALDNNASVAPVSMAWKKARELTGDTINLYNSDESHPSIYGSYLTACVFYASIFNKNPIGNSFHSTLPEPTALLLQTIANNVVFDSSYIWNFQTANFGSILVSDYTLSFTGTENTDTDFWDFGDNLTSTEHNPTHVYPNEGEYIVKHIITNNCISDTIIHEVTSAIFLDIDNYISDFNIFPNPAKDYLIIENNKIVIRNLYIIDINGKIVCSQPVSSKNTQINISYLDKGFYFIKIGNTYKKFIKR